MIPMTRSRSLANRADWWRGRGSPDRVPQREVMLLPRRMAVLFVVLALAGCASMSAGPGQTPNAPHQQGDPRDTSGMH
jgi:hypothetical protein